MILFKIVITAVTVLNGVDGVAVVIVVVVVAVVVVVIVAVALDDGISYKKQVNLLRNGLYRSHSYIMHSTIL